MEHQHTEADLKQIAQQLAKPDGEYGIKTGEVMNVSNIGMTHAAIESVGLEEDDIILEIGHGNGGHIAHLLSQATNLRYYGADISETIVDEAKRINADFVARQLVHFELTDGKTLPYNDQYFNKIFTVNTIYFWEDPIGYLDEIKRVLKPKGSFVICFADKGFMQKLPFTSFGFRLYDVEEVKQLLLSGGYQITNIRQEREQIKSNAGFMVERDYHVITATI